VAEHLPIRPSWTCSACGRPWPCDTARVDLLTGYADVPVALAVYLAGCFLEAVAGQPAVPSEKLYLRFLGWLQLRRPTVPDPASTRFGGIG
jgi:hypothetical protein